MPSVSLRFHTERRISVGREEKGVGLDSERPAHDPHYEVEHPSRKAPSEQYREPGDNYHGHKGNPEEEQHDVVGDSQEPFYKRKPSVQVLLNVWVEYLNVNRLLLIRGWLLVAQEQEIYCNSVGKPHEVHVPVEPPPGILLPEQDH